METHSGNSTKLQTYMIKSVPQSVTQPGKVWVGGSGSDGGDS